MLQFEGDTPFRLWSAKNILCGCVGVCVCVCVPDISFNGSAAEENRQDAWKALGDNQKHHSRPLTPS